MTVRLFFEDFHPGDRATYPATTVSEEEIVAFARAYDPQPFHVDPVAARDSFVGTLIASGWHTCALLMRAMCEGFLLESSSLGAPGVESVRWLAPVRPGAVLVGGHEVLETRASRSRPDMGLVRFRFELAEAGGAPVLEQTNWILFARRDAEPVPASPIATGPGAPAPALGPDAPLPVFEDVVVGSRVVLGSETFTREDILAFARAYDFQRFHLDEAEAARTHFGGLCASGWHTAAGWMKHMVAHIERGTRAARAAGLRPGRLGPSPGFENLTWSRPVRPGDVVTYTSTVTRTRRTLSRPGWGLVFHRNEGVNQRGETVFGFDGCVFWEAREP